MLFVRSVVRLVRIWRGDFAPSAMLPSVARTSSTAPPPAPCVWGKLAAPNSHPSRWSGTQTHDMMTPSRGTRKGLDAALRAASQCLALCFGKTVVLECGGLTPLFSFGIPKACPVVRNAEDHPWCSAPRFAQKATSGFRRSVEGFKTNAVSAMDDSSAQASASSNRESGVTRPQSVRRRIALRAGAAALQIVSPASCQTPFRA
jgi:hypothetical protein